MSTQSVLPPDDTTGAHTQRAMRALHNATWFALCEGDRYTAMGRKAVANSFYNLLPMLAEIRKAIVEDAAAPGVIAPQAPAND